MHEFQDFQIQQVQQDLLKAVDMLNGQFYNIAISLLQKINSAYPNKYQIIFLLANALYGEYLRQQKQGKIPTQEALEEHQQAICINTVISYLDKAIEINPTFLESYILLALIYDKLGMYQLAIQTYNKAEKIDPQNINVQQYYGKHLLQHNQYEKAIEKFEQYIKLDSGSDIVYLQLSLSLYCCKRYDEAIQGLLKYLQADPNNFRVNLALGYYYFQVQSYQLSEKYLRIAKSLSPLKANAIDHLILLGYRKSGRLEEFYQQCSYFGMNQLVSQHHLVFSTEQLIYEGRFDVDKVLQINERLMDNTNMQFQCQSILGIFYYRQSQYEQAKYYLEKADKIQPNNQAILQYLGQISLFQGNIQLSIKYFQKIKYKSAEVNIYIGLALCSAGQFQQSIQKIEQTVANCPNEVLNYLGLAYVYLQKKEYLKAFKNITIAIELGPQLVNVIYFQYILKIKACTSQLNQPIKEFLINISQKNKDYAIMDLLVFNILISCYNYDKFIPYFNKFLSIIRIDFEQNQQKKLQLFYKKQLKRQEIMMTSNSSSKLLIQIKQFNLGLGLLSYITENKTKSTFYFNQIRNIIKKQQIRTHQKQKYTNQILKTEFKRSHQQIFSLLYTQLICKCQQNNRVLICQFLISEIFLQDQHQAMLCYIYLLKQWPAVKYQFKFIKLINDYKWMKIEKIDNQCSKMPNNLQNKYINYSNGQLRLKHISFINSIDQFKVFLETLIQKQFKNISQLKTIIFQTFSIDNSTRQVYETSYRQVFDIINKQQTNLVVEFYRHFQKYKTKKELADKLYQIIGNYMKNEHCVNQKIKFIFNQFGYYLLQQVQKLKFLQILLLTKKEGNFQLHPIKQRLKYVIEDENETNSIIPYTIISDISQKQSYLDIQQSITPFQTGFYSLINEKDQNNDCQFYLKNIMYLKDNKFKFKNEQKYQQLNQIVFINIYSIINYLAKKKKTFIALHFIEEKQSQQILKQNSFSFSIEKGLKANFQNMQIEQEKWPIYDIWSRGRDYVYSWIVSIATAIMQLEIIGIFHADISFSNALLFGRFYKLIDFDYSFKYKLNQHQSIFNSAFQATQKIIQFWVAFSFENAINESHYFDEILNYLFCRNIIVNQQEITEHECYLLSLYERVNKTKKQQKVLTVLKSLEQYCPKYHLRQFEKCITQLLDDQLMKYFGEAIKYKERIQILEILKQLRLELIDYKLFVNRVFRVMKKYQKQI